MTQEAQAIENEENLNFEQIKERLAKNPGILLEKLSISSEVSPAQLIECLPEEMWTKVSGEHFVEALQQIKNWGKVTTIVHTADVIMEYMDEFPDGSVGHGYYNLNSPGNSLHGHLRYKLCDAIYFVERPFNGMETKSILFANAKGDFMFKIFLGRNENREIKPDQIVLFKELAVKFNQSA